MKTKEENWSLPYNTILWRDKSLPKDEYRWFEERDLLIPDSKTKKGESYRSRFMGRGYFDENDKKTNCLFLTSWECEFRAESKTNEEWEKEVKKYPLWNKSKYILKLADMGGFGLYYSDRNERVKNQEEIDSVLSGYPEMFKKNRLAA